MFSRISAFFHQAAELSSQVLSDSLSHRDAFKALWQTITDAITDNGSIVTIKRELKEMVKILCLEEEAVDPVDLGTVGPCMEFLLRHKLMDTLYTAGKNNYPAGMKQEVVAFFTALLEKLKRPLLHHVSIHQPVLFQIKDCGLDPLDAAVEEESRFIHVLLSRLSLETSLIDFFVSETENGSIFLLSEALIRLTNCSINSVVMTAYENLLLCTALSHPSAATAMATGKLPLLLASKLQFHFQLIPSSVTYIEVLTSQAISRIDATAYCHLFEQSPSTYGIYHVEAFFFWLKYCEKITFSAQELLAKAVCENISEIFLTASMLPKMMKHTEEDILVSTSVLARAIQVTSCKKLLQTLVSFVLNESIPSEGTTLKETVTRRIDHVNEDVCQVTLQLFDSLLHSNLSTVFEDLASCQLHEICCDSFESVRLKLEEDIVAYLSLIPDSLRSSRSVSGESGLDQYLEDSHNVLTQQPHFAQIQRTKTDLLSEHDEANRSTTDNLFFDMLLNKLDSTLDQAYSINLLVTAILIKLAAVPHSLLNILFETKTQRRNVYTLLKKTAVTLQMRFERTPGLVVHLIEARRRLAGQATSDLLSMPHNNFLEGVILLEEFTKELSSIIFAKTTRTLLALN